MQAPQGFGLNHYVPVFKLKKGERDALAKLEYAPRSRVTPLFEICPPAPKRVAGRKETRLQTMDEVLNKVGPNLAKSISNRRAFLDGVLLARTDRMVSGAHPLEYALAEARKAGSLITPVTGPERDREYQAVVKAAVALDQAGVCIRLQKNELFGGEVDKLLASTLRTVGSRAEMADLVLDLGAIEPCDDVNRLATSIVGILGSISGMMEFRSLTLSAGAFPQKISHINEPTKIERTDWRLWQAVIAKAKSVVRLPSFGDYGIQGTLPLTTGAAMHSGSANIRYTADNHWLVLRGKSVKFHGNEQYAGLAEHLIGEKCFAGRGFSWGDDYIYGCANNVETPGDAGVWRKVGTSHHLAQVLKQLTSHRAT